MALEIADANILQDGRHERIIAPWFDLRPGIGRYQRTFNDLMRPLD